MADERKEVESRVVGIIQEHLGKEGEGVSLDADLVRDLGADSLDLQEIMMNIDDYEGMKLEIKSEDVGNLRTPRDIVNYIIKYKK